MSVSIADLVDNYVAVQVSSVNFVERVLVAFNFSSCARSLCFLSVAIEDVIIAQLTLKDHFCCTTNPFTIQAINLLLDNIALP